MRHSFYSILAVFLVSLFSVTQAADWKIDQAHTNIGFTVSHLVISDVTGRFAEFDGTFTASADDFSGSQVYIVFKTASITTAAQKRDDHLRSKDFFDAANNPEIIFKSTSFKKIDDINYEVKGQLSMNGVTKEVVLKTVLKGQTKDPWGGTRAAFKATTSLDRYDYNLTYNKALETGGFLIGKKVDVEINLQIIKK